MHSWVKEIQACSNEMPRPFPREDNYEIAKTYRQKFKIFFFRTTGPISTKLGIMHPWVKVIKDCSYGGPRSFPRGDIYEIALINEQNLKKKFFSRTTEPISTKSGTMHPWVKGIQVCSNEEPINSHKVFLYSLNQCYHIIIFV